MYASLVALVPESDNSHLATGPCRRNGNLRLFWTVVRASEWRFRQMFATNGCSIPKDDYKIHGQAVGRRLGLYRGAKGHRWPGYNLEIIWS